MRVIKLRRMRWAGRAARMRQILNVYKISVGKPRVKKTWEGETKTRE